MSHPQHPKCPSCGKALFKSYTAAKVRPADPYRFCRNAKCASAGPGGIGLVKALVESKPRRNPPMVHGPGQNPVETALKKAAAAKAEPPKPPTRARKAKPAPAKPPSKPVENDVIAKARARIRELIKEAAEGRPAVSVGLVLAIVNQETGNHKAANALIDDFALDRRFGLQKFEPPGETAAKNSSK